MVLHEIIIYQDREQPPVYRLKVCNLQTGHTDLDVGPIPNATQVLRVYRVAMKAIQTREAYPSFRLTIDDSVTEELPEELGSRQIAELAVRAFGRATRPRTSS